MHFSLSKSTFSLLAVLQLASALGIGNNALVRRACEDVTTTVTVTQDGSCPACVACPSCAACPTAAPTTMTLTETETETDTTTATTTSTETDTVTSTETDTVTSTTTSTSVSISVSISTATVTQPAVTVTATQSPSTITKYVTVKSTITKSSVHTITAPCTAKPTPPWGNPGNQNGPAVQH